MAIAVAFLIILAKTRETLPEKAAEEFSYRDTRKVLRDGVYLFLCMMILLNAFAYAQFFSSLPVYATNDLGVTVSGVALFFALNGAMVVALQIMITNHAVKLRRSSALAIGQALTALGVGLIFFADGFTGVLVAVAILTFGELFLSAVMFALVADLSAEKMRGTYMGFTGLVMGIGEGIGMLLGLTLLDVLEMRSLLWIIVAVASVPAVFGFAYLRKVVPDGVDRGRCSRYEAPGNEG